MLYLKCAAKISSKIGLFFLLISPCYSGEIITEYVLYASSFTTAQRNAIRNYGRNNDRQPAIRTMLERYDHDSNLYKLRLTTYTDVENTAVVNALTQGKIQKLSSFEIITQWNGRENVTFCGNRQTYMNEPKLFEVEVTTQ